MNASAVARLEEIYKRLPTVLCRGKCQADCGPIDMTRVERDRIRAASGLTIPVGHTGDNYPCPALGMLGQCIVHGLRPLICRAYGAVEGLTCKYGCEPEEGLLSREEWMHLWADAMVAAGEMTLAHAARFRTHLDDPRVVELYAATARGVPGAAYELHKHMAGAMTGDVSGQHASRVSEGVTRLQLRMAGCENRACC